MRTLLLISALSLAAAVLPANAATPDIEARYSPGFKACTDKAQSTLETVGCMSDEHDLQDKALNGAYQHAMDGLTPGQKTKLRDAQRAWIGYRDLWCRAQQDDDWGSISTIVAANCLVDETIRRTIQLESYPPET